MHLIERAPRTYLHRGYMVEALPGPRGWNIWRRSEDLAFCSVDCLRDAEAVIAEDLTHNQLVRQALGATGVPHWAAAAGQ